MIQNGLLETLSTIFAEETDPDILVCYFPLFHSEYVFFCLFLQTVGCLLSCVISENLRIVDARAEQKIARFVQSLLNSLTV